MGEDESRQYGNRPDRRLRGGAAVRRRFEAVVPNPKLKLMDAMREVLRLEHQAMPDLNRRATTRGNGVWGGLRPADQGAGAGEWRAWRANNPWAARRAPVLPGGCSGIAPAALPCASCISLRLRDLAGGYAGGGVLAG